MNSPPFTSITAAGDEFGGVGGKKENHLGDVLGPSQPSQRNASPQVVDLFTGKLPDDVGLGGSRSHGIDIDIIGSHSAGYRHGESDDAGLGGRIGHAVGIAAHPAGQGGQIDDPA